MEHNPVLIDTTPTTGKVSATASIDFDGSGYSDYSEFVENPNITISPISTVVQPGINAQTIIPDLKHLGN